MAIYELPEIEDEPIRQRVPNPEIAILASWRTELKGYFGQLKQFQRSDPADIFMSLAGMSARASEIRFEVMEAGDSRRLSAFRTRQLDPFLEEVDRQFRVWSRVQAVRQMDADLTRGI